MRKILFHRLISSRQFIAYRPILSEKEVWISKKPSQSCWRAFVRLSVQGDPSRSIGHAVCSWQVVQDLVRVRMLKVVRLGEDQLAILDVEVFYDLTEARLIAPEVLVSGENSSFLVICKSSKSIVIVLNRVMDFNTISDESISNQLTENVRDFPLSLLDGGLLPLVVLFDSLSRACISINEDFEQNVLSLGHLSELRHSFV